MVPRCWVSKFRFCFTCVIFFSSFLFRIRFLFSPISFPVDVSLQANFIAFVANSNCWPTGGTSASAPLFAGMLALIADARQVAGLGRGLGLANTALYHLATAAPEVFNDITIGANRCTGVYGNPPSHTCCPLGFNATKGWDPVTGLGTVNFSQLKKAWLKLFR